MNFKRKSVLIIICFSLSFSLYAKPLGELVDSLLTLNRQKDISCEIMIDDQTDDQVATLCAEQVCGPATNYPVTLDVESAKPYLNKKTQQQINDIEQEFKDIDQTLERYTKFLQAKQNELKRISDPAKISDGDAEEILSQIIIDIMSINGSLPSTEDKNFVLDSSASPHYAAIYKEVISKINIKENINFSILNGVDLDDQQFNDQFFKNAEIFKKEIKNKKLKTDYDIDAKIEFVKKYSPSHTVSFSLELLQVAQALGIRLHKPVCNIQCKKSLVTYLKTAKYFDSIKLKKDIKSIFTDEDSLAICRSSMIFHNINVQNSEAIEKEWPKLINRFKDNTSLKLSTHSKNLILNTIASKVKLKFKREPFDYKLDSDQVSLMENDMKDISLASLYTQTTNKDIFREHAQTARCEPNLNGSLMTDHFNLEDYTLNVSPFTCEHHHMGKEILAHELGHVVSRIIEENPNMSKESMESFIDLRSCSRAEKKTSSQRTGTLVFHPGDKLTTEEDTADLFSHALSTDKNTFMGCIFLSDGQTFKNTNMIVTNPFDTHSLTLVRLMIELQYKNPAIITETCAEVIKRSQSKITKKCL